MEIEKSINIGANFCQKESIKHRSQLEDLITAGNQWWKGTTANFIKMPRVINNKGFIDEAETPPRRMRRDPKAWGRKYLIGASFWLFDIFKRGIKEIILISKRIHIIIQFVEDRIDNEEIRVRKMKRAENI